MDTTRIRRAQEAMQAEGIDALLVGPSPDLRWLVGYDALPLERLTMLVVPAEADPQLVVPALEAPRAEASGATAYAELRPWEEVEDPIAVVRDLLTATGSPRVLAVQDQLWSSFTLALQQAVTSARWVAGSRVTRELRVVKTDDEIAALRAAGAAIDAVHAQVAEMLRPGRTEAEVGREITERILDDHDVVNFVIVGSGPNGASPHHELSDRPLAEGDPVVVDIGGTREGYCSDETRNYVVGRCPAEYAEVHRVLEEAQRAGVAAVVPGATAESVDAAAREVIADAGYGDSFIHRTGHGIGVEEHEPPWIVAGNTEALRAGMAFSVEPGIYLPDRFGARIEDVVIVTDDGAESVNHRPRHVIEAG